MRNISETMLAHFKTGATTICRCWLVTRVDGVQMGFTDHDADLEFDGVTYHAATGFDAAALQASAGLSVDNSEAVGALSSDGITELDIALGKYDGAEILQTLVNWQDVSQRLAIFRGSLGEITRGDSAFEVELRGLAEALSGAVGHVYLRQCDARLGDTRCGKDISDPAYTGLAKIDRVEGSAKLFINGADAYADGWFSSGRLEWVSGANAGQISNIRLDTLEDGLRIIDLWQEPYFGFAPDDDVRLIAGCDKLAKTCREKFANFASFRGFPHQPGEDWTTAYPVSGGANAGGSIVPYD